MESIGRYSAAIYRLNQSILNEKLRELEISSGQHDFLLVIANNEGISQKELCDYLHVEKSTTAKAVRQLLDKGYVYNKPVENDKRYASLFLTDKGRAAAKLVTAVFSDMISIVSEGIPEELVDQTIDVLKKVISNLQTEKYRLIAE